MKRILVLATLLVGLAAPAQADSTTPPPDPNDKRRYTSYMAFGDSISTKLQTPSGDFVNPYYSWERVRGYGIGKTSAREMNTWWPDYLDDLGNPPKVAIILIGVNDLKTGVSARSLITRYKRLIETGERHNIEVVFGTLTSSPKGSTWRVIEKRRRIVNAWIRRRDKFVDYAAATTCHPKQYLCDYYAHPSMRDVHPNDLGQQAMGEVLIDFIESDR